MTGVLAPTALLQRHRPWRERVVRAGDSSVSDVGLVLRLPLLLLQVVQLGQESRLVGLDGLPRQLTIQTASNKQTHKERHTLECLLALLALLPSSLQAGLPRPVSCAPAGGVCGVGEFYVTFSLPHRVR